MQMNTRKINILSSHRVSFVRIPRLPLHPKSAMVRWWRSIRVRQMHMRRRRVQIHKRMIEMTHHRMMRRRRRSRRPNRRAWKILRRVRGEHLYMIRQHHRQRAGLSTGDWLYGPPLRQQTWRLRNWIRRRNDLQFVKAVVGLGFPQLLRTIGRGDVHLFQTVDYFVEAFFGWGMLHRIMLLLLLLLYMPWRRFRICSRFRAGLFRRQRFQWRRRRFRGRRSAFARQRAQTPDVIIKLVDLFVVHLFVFGLLRLIAAAVLNRRIAVVDFRSIRRQFIVIGRNATGEFRHFYIAFSSQPLKFRPGKYLGII